jgi:hypothetical protein
VLSWTGRSRLCAGSIRSGKVALLKIADWILNEVS